VVALLGIGGMGEVYRARDPRLGRDVALKILPAAFTSDPDRLARFEREARVLASLNHPRIGAIYGLEEAASASGQLVRALVLELVEGETLAERIASGPMPVRDAVTVAIQLADALDAAHEKGIVHRDLKPANIKVSADLAVKVLDFGLATASIAGGTDVTRAPTSGGDRTSAGMILGTAPYMSPEQARGQPVDKRTDVWAFGCVLFEMLTGRRAFAGDTVSDTIARILQGEIDWSALPATLPDGVRRVLVRSVVKDPRHRLRDIADARLELEETLAAAPPRSLPPATRTASRAAVFVGFAAALIAIAAIGSLAAWRYSRRSDPMPQPVAVLTVALGANESFARDVAVSPDGAYVAYNAGPPGDDKTYLRALSERQSRVVAELPMSAPFFSPDSEWLGIFDAGKLKKIPVKGGSAVVLADAPAPRGGAWAGDGSIVFAPAARTGLMLVPPSGAPRALTTPDPARGETSHRQPAFLPGSRTVIFTAEGTTTRNGAFGSRRSTVPRRACCSRARDNSRDTCRPVTSPTSKSAT
jgi:hypothetical protein